MSNPSIASVVKGSFCMGCGACAYVSNYKMLLNKYGEFEPDLSLISSLKEQKDAEFVCPSLNPEYNENVLSDHFLKSNPLKNEKLGYYTSIYGAYVKERNYREHSTSGGFGTWLGVELLKKGHIDGVIHLKSVSRIDIEAPLYRYGISTTEEEIRKASKTKYHIVEVSEVLKLIESNAQKKYLFIGLPCIIKAIRRIQLINEQVRKSIPYTAALICGHLKSVNWTLSLAWGKNIPPSNLETLIYRTKGEHISIRSYCFTAYTKTEPTKGIIKNSADVIGGKFNQGALMLPACNFCDDLVGETADITIGDAWLAKYEIDNGGTNLLIVRNKMIDELIGKALSEDRIFADYLSEKEAIYAQAGGFRQRREGLAYRLKKKNTKGQWCPEKRISKDQFNPTLLRKQIYKYRDVITQKSRIVFRKALDKDDYQVYSKNLKWDLKILRYLEVSCSISRILKNRVSKIFLKRKFQ